MAVYEFRGYNPAGKLIKGVREADGTKSLRGALRKEGIRVTEVKDSKGRKSKSKTKKSGSKSGAKSGDDEEQDGAFLAREVDFSAMRRISVDDIGVATRQLATLLEAGVPMVESLTAVIDQIENPAFKNIFAHIKDDVNEGSALADAMAEHRIFDHVFVNMVRAGEQSGTLEIVLERLAEFKEGQSRLRGEIMGAMIYPIIMVFVGMGVMGILLTVVVPKISRIFEHANAQLPILTRMLIATSGFARSYWWLVLIVMVGGIIFTKQYLQSPKGRENWDRIALRLPVFGPLVRMIAMARFARTLSTLLQSGVSLLVSFDIVKNVVANATIAQAIDEAKEAVREGEDIAKPLKRSAEFPPMVVHMIAIGEKSGQLEAMLGRVASAYEHRVESRMKAMTSLLEPVMILSMAVVVGLIVFAILMPILQMNQLVG